MKQCTTKIQNILEITMLVELESETHVAASKVSHPKNVKKRYLYSDQQLADFNDLVDSVISILTYYKFDIVSEGQSKGSYSYYIDFFPTDDQGNRWDETVRIKFRLSNHSNKGADNALNNQRSKQYSEADPMVYIKSFYLGSKKYPGQLAIMNAVKQICLGLKEGNYEKLEQY